MELKLTQNKISNGMKNKKIEKEYNYNLLLGFLFMWTLLIGFSFIKLSTHLAFQGYEYMLANTSLYF